MRPAHQERTAGGKRVYDSSLEEGAGGVWGTQGCREKLLEGQEAEGGEELWEEPLLWFLQEGAGKAGGRWIGQLPRALGHKDSPSVEPGPGVIRAGG